MQHRLTPVTLLPLLSAVAVLVPACTTTAPEPEPLKPPALDIDIRHFAGTVLSGRKADPEFASRIAAEKSLQVRCRVSYLRALHTSGLAPLATRTRLVVAGRSGEPLAPVARFTTGACVGSRTQARDLVAALTARREDHRTLADLRGVLHEGLTAAIHTHGKEWVRTDDGAPTRRNAVIMVSIEKGEKEPTVALQIDDLSGATIDDPSERVTRRQIVLLEDAPVIDGDALVMMIPSPFVRDMGRAFLVEISVRGVTAGDDLHRELVARCRNDLRRAGEEARAGGSQFGAEEARDVTLATSLSALDTARHRRPSVVFLARSTGAELALDLALAADDETLAAFVLAAGPHARARVLARVQAEPGQEAESGDSADDVGWILEKTAYELLAQRLDNGELPKELRGVLAQRAGEVGRFPGAIGDALKHCRNRADLERVLELENLGFSTLR